MKRFFPLFVLMVCLLGLHPVWAVDLISIANLSLDASADKATDARALAQKQGTQQAVKQALQQIASDPAAVTDAMLASANIDSRYVYATDIVREKVSARRYQATVTMHLYTTKVRDLASRLGLKTKQQPRANTLVIPFWQDASEVWHTTFPADQTVAIQEAVGASGVTLLGPTDPAQVALKTLTTLPLSTHPIITDLRARYPSADIRYVTFQPQDTAIHVSVFVPESGGMRTLGEFDQPLNAGEVPSAPTYKTAMTEALTLLQGASPSASPTSGQTTLTLTIAIPDVKGRFQALSIVRTAPDVVSANVQGITPNALRLSVILKGEGTQLQETLIASGYTLTALDETTWTLGQE
jgi:hypothetical protein